MIDEGAQTRRILGRICLRYAAHKLLNQSPQAAVIVHGQHGKPEIPNLSISISHTACLDNTQLCVCSAGTGSNAEFGIDIAMRNKPIGYKISAAELIQRLKQNKSLGTENEWNQTLRYDDPIDQLNEFYRFWAVKESVLKATGEGASALRPSRIDISTNSLHPFETSQPVISDTLFAIDNIVQNGRVFEEAVTVSNTQFYLAETSLLAATSTDEDHMLFTEMIHLKIEDIAKCFHPSI